jgi:hypothetical protein
MSNAAIKKQQNNNQPSSSNVLSSSYFQPSSPLLPNSKNSSDQQDETLQMLRPKLIKLLQQVIDDENKRQFAVGLANRHQFAILLNRFEFKTMIEIGVKQGGFAHEILSRWRGFEHYYGIDLWQQQKNYNEGANVKDDEQTRFYDSASSSLRERFGKDRITLIRSYSSTAVHFFNKTSIDFIYVDARHDYCGVAEDLNNYFPILRCGGLFAGHDYQFESGQPDGDWGICANGTRVEGAVKKAVLDFAKQQGVQKVYNTGEGEYVSWYFLKECDKLS